MRWLLLLLLVMSANAQTTSLITTNATHPCDCFGCTNCCSCWAFTNAIQVASSQVVHILNFSSYGSSPGLVVLVDGGNRGITKSDVPMTLAGPLMLHHYDGLLTYKVVAKDEPIQPGTGVVIPTDATGPVEIILESSADLVNWTAAVPGTYGSNTTNRFFRVRAVRH